MKNVFLSVDGSGHGTIIHNAFLDRLAFLKTQFGTLFSFSVKSVE